jgi:U3 small nucleolar RNA-associated protein 19
MLVPFTYNILKRHPTLMALIHRVPPDGADPASIGTFPSPHFSYASRPLTHALRVDPFDAAEPNPNLTHAIDSSLWELHSHVRHYHAAAATLARIFEAPFTKPNYAMEDFLDHTYGTVRSFLPFM